MFIQHLNNTKEYLYQFNKNILRESEKFYTLTQVFDGKATRIEHYDSYESAKLYTLVFHSMQRWGNSRLLEQEVKELYNELH